MSDPDCKYGPKSERCGKLSTYTGHGCRGEACNAANNKYYLEIRPAKMAKAGRLCEQECGRPVYAKDLCHTCYERERRHYWQQAAV